MARMPLSLSTPASRIAWGVFAGLVIGNVRQDPRLRIAPSADLPWIGAIARHNGVVEETGLAAGVMGHPAAGVAWLVRKLAQVGEGLKAGQIVLAGSFTRVVFAKKGDTLHGDFGQLGGISVQFV